MTADQVGYVPNLKVNFTENTETFCQDTYKFQSMREFPTADGSGVRGLVNINLIEEHYLEKVINEYVPMEDDLFDFKIRNICTVQQLEIFYRTFILDLYRRENSINYTFRENIEKRYFIVPLRLTKPSPDQLNAQGERVAISYEIDIKLLQKTERLH